MSGVSDWPNGHKKTSHKVDLTLRVLAAMSATAALLAASEANAQTAPSNTTLPPVTVESKAPAKKAPPAKKQVSAPAPVATAPPPVAPPAPPQPTGPQPNAKGDIGYEATRTSTATKTDTPLRNIPQSISVVTEQQIKDQAFLSIGDVTKYVPGVILHQGEGNRDQVSIRGQVASTADFFVDGVRDDAQIFRDLYNSERLEFLKGPSALIFGRGGAGGIVNRVTKQPEFRPAFGELTVEYGSWDHKRTVIDTGAALSSAAAFRLTGMYENSGSYRDGVDLERWGVNPTFAFKIDDRTKVTLGYEHYEDHRTADRGIPSYRPPGAQYAIPSPASPSQFFGSPQVNFANAEVDRVYGIVEHKTDFGLTIRNHTSWASYDKMYQNVYPGGPLTGGNVMLSAYNNINNRENIFNQTDFIYKFDLGWSRHTLLAGMEFGHQESFNWRHDGQFNAGGNTNCTNSLPSSNCFVPFGNSVLNSPSVNFNATRTKNSVEADVRSFYIQDQMQITRYLEVIGGVRHDTFSVDYTNLGVVTATLPASLSQTDELVSPRAGVIIKPTDYFSLYGTYSISYLPPSGDQFSSFSLAAANLEPEKYTNYEVGAKWDITKSLAFTSALYRVDRENVRFTYPDGTLVQTGTSRVEGAEATLIGYLTRDWQISLGYNHIFKGELTSATSPTLPAGTPLPLLPTDTFSIWNRYNFTNWFGAGIGLVYHTDMFASLQPANNLVQLPSYTTVDGALFFKINEKMSAQVNLINIFDEKYIASADSNDNLTPGSPRAAFVSITTKF